MLQRFSVFCLILNAQAQTPPAQPASGAIAGIVVDRNHDAPIRRAVVTLSTLEPRPREAVAWTGSDGRFSFGNLPAGRYRLAVLKNGYQFAVHGTDSFRLPPEIIQLAVGESRTDFVFRLQVLTSISGVVADQDGDPVPGVQVMAMSLRWRRNKLQLVPGAGATTDSTGRYRLTGLTPGRYAVSAAHLYRPAFKVNPEAVAGEPQQQYAYGVQYYPGTGRSDSATLIPIQAGQELLEIDFRLEARLATAVQGKVILPPGAASAKDAIVSAMNVDLANRSIMGVGAPPPDLVFRFDTLPPGTYRLLAQATVEGRRYRGAQLVETGLGAAPDVLIPVEPGVDLEGKVSVEGPDAAKYPVSSVNLTPGDGLPLNGPPPRANVDKDGGFKFTDLPAGVWDIGVSPIPPRGYIKSMRLGDQDVLTEEMTIRSSTSAPLHIVLATQAAIAQGEVVTGADPARAMVLLAPEDKFRHVLSFYRFAPTEEKGRFEIRNVMPGKYDLFAFEEFDGQSIQDPEFLKRFESTATPVTLREGQNPPLKLSLIPAAGGPR